MFLNVQILMSAATLPILVMETVIPQRAITHPEAGTAHAQTDIIKLRLVIMEYIVKVSLNDLSIYSVYISSVLICSRCSS